MQDPEFRKWLDQGHAVLINIGPVLVHNLVGCPQELLVVDGLVLDSRDQLLVNKVSECSDEGELVLMGASVQEEVPNILGILGVDVLVQAKDDIGQAMRNGEEEILNPLRDPLNVLRLLTGPVLDVAYLLTVKNEILHGILLVIMILLVVYNMRK